MRHEWTCCACHAVNSVEDGECQFCECQGDHCKRDNCSDPIHPVVELESPAQQEAYES